MKLVIASGKGGTGKTTLSVALTQALTTPTLLLDCDVEEPNCHLFFDDSSQQSTPVTQPVPVVDIEVCNGCGKCSDLCQFSAIISFAGADAMVFPELCHSCGGCIEVCPTGAITEVPFEIGTLETTDLTHTKALITGKLAIGHAMAPPIIKEVFKASQTHPLSTVESKDLDVTVQELTIIADAPPGTSCPFVTAAKEGDYVIFITEPTPFGLHDLSIAVATIKEIGTPFGVVINRMHSADNVITEYCCENEIKVLLQIPESRIIAENYSNGKSLLEALPSMKEKLNTMVHSIRTEVA